MKKKIFVLLTFSFFIYANEKSLEDKKQFIIQYFRTLDIDSKKNYLKELAQENTEETNVMWDYLLNYAKNKKDSEIFLYYFLLYSVQNNRNFLQDNISLEKDFYQKFLSFSNMNLRIKILETFSRSEKYFTLLLEKEYDYLLHNMQYREKVYFTEYYYFITLIKKQTHYAWKILLYDMGKKLTNMELKKLIYKKEEELKEE